MADTGENNGGGSMTIGQIASEILGTSANPTVATAILDWEISWGAQYGTGIAVALALADLPVSMSVLAGMAAGYLAGYATDYVTGLVNNAAAEMQQNAGMMNAINMDGAGFAMPDPVTGTGYW